MENEGTGIAALLDAYAETCRQTSHPQNQSRDELASYDAQVDRTLSRLQERVKEQEAALEEVSIS